MTTTFLAPCANENAEYNLRNTVLTPVPSEVLDSVRTSTTSEEVRVWGVPDTGGQGSAWEEIREGDQLLFYTGDSQFKYTGKVDGKEHNSALTRALEENGLWKPYTRQGGHYESDDPWELIIYLSEIREVAVDSNELLENFAGQGKHWVQKFRKLPRSELSRDFYCEYDNLEEYILSRKDE